MILNIQQERLTDGSEAYNLLLSQGEATIEIPCLFQAAATEMAAAIQISVQRGSNEEVTIIGSVKQ